MNNFIPTFFFFKRLIMCLGQDYKPTFLFFSFVFKTSIFLIFSKNKNTLTHFLKKTPIFKIETTIYHFC